MSVGSIYGGTSNRITGLASGLDTDAVIKNMMALEQAKLDRINQNKQTLLWKQDIYRGVIDDIRGLQNKYFDVLSDDYILSSSKLNSFDITFQENLKALNVSAGEGAIEGNYKVSVTEKASEAKYTGSSVNKATSNPNNFPIRIDDSNKEITIGTEKITIEAKDYANIYELKDEINLKLGENEKLKDMTATVKDGNIQFAKKVEVKADDKFVIKLDDTPEGTFEFQLKEGSYSIDEIISNITTQMKDKKYKDKPLSEVVELSSKDGMSISVKGIDDSITVTDGKVTTNGVDEFKVEDLKLAGTISSTGTDSKVNGNVLQFEKEIITGLNDELKISIDGKEHIIKIPEGNYTNLDGRVDTEKFSKAIQGEIGKNTELSDLKVGFIGEKLVFESSSSKTIKFSGAATATLGIKENVELSLNTNEKVSEVFGANGKVTFKINNVEFEYDFDGEHKDMTLEKLMNDIEEKANVEIQYSELTRSFSMKSKGTGSHQELKIEDVSGGLMGKIFGSTPTEAIKGTDAKVTITNPNGETNTVVKDSNSFTIDGVTYNISGMTAGEEVSFSISKNTDEMFDKVVGFIDEYNKIIEDINGLLTEKYDRSYQPLTDAQKEEMSEKEIERWEEKAKEGLLKGDPLLSNLKNSLRGVWAQPVKGSQLSFGDRSIGIDTSKEFNDGGKIVITDEAKLKEVLNKDPEAFMDLFIGKSESVPTYNRDLTAEQRKTRNEEQGIFGRISDIMNDYTSTMRDKNGRKGLLIEKAGVTGDSSVSKNTIYDKVEEQNETIKEMQRRMSEKEQRLYSQFARLEAQMNQLNSQSSYLYQQMGMA